MAAEKIRILRKVWGESSPIPNSIRQSLRTASAQAQDAIRFLKRAAPTLRERRKNVWWTRWYFERYVRAIALISWAALIEPGEQIPFFGLEDVMRNTDSLADTLLIDSVRMIRVDAYRLAMALISYASATAALKIRLELDGEVPGLSRRPDLMKKHLESGERTLENAFSLREQLPAALQGFPERFTRSAMDPVVRASIVRVQRIVSAVFKTI